VRTFKVPKATLGYLDAEAVAALITAAADIAVIVDAEGVVRDLAYHSDELSADLDGPRAWIDRPWVETVTPESREKIVSLLADARARASAGWRQVNHPSSRGPDIPVLYSVVQVGQQGRVVAIGRDLRPMAVLQQRLVEAQASMDRDYSRLRHVEMRYRLLFELSADALMIVDAGTLAVAEANPAARQLFAGAAGGLVGGPFAAVFSPAGADSVRDLLANVRVSGRADDVRAEIAGTDRQMAVSASLFRHEGTTLFLVRLTAPDAPTAATDLSKLNTKLLKVLQSVPDGVVVTSPDGRILSANSAFLELAQMAVEEQVRGEPLGRWLGRPGVDIDVLVANLRQRGSVRLFGTVLRPEYGATTDVEVSAVSVMNGGRPCFGFTIRNVGRRLSTETRPGRELPRSVEHLTELIGRVSLKDLVRETTDVVERLCIEAALQLTGDNRASAAEVLGLSRQSLYVKLRRYGLADASADGSGQG